MQVTGPDGSIAIFPDGMARVDIEEVMAKIYPPEWSLDAAFT
jgi:hypothetical protein